MADSSSWRSVPTTKTMNSEHIDTMIYRALSPTNSRKLQDSLHMASDHLCMLPNMNSATDKEPMVLITLRLPEDQHVKLREAAKSSHRTVSGELRHLIAQRVDEKRPDAA